MDGTGSDGFRRHGGIFIIGTGGKIVIDNTLEQRLRVIQADCLPVVRASLFGENPHRKFHD
jgi:V-type H+-transporting ATPase subunit E